MLFACLGNGDLANLSSSISVVWVIILFYKKTLGGEVLVLHDIRNRVVGLGRTKKILLTAIITMIASVIILLAVSGSKISMALAFIATVIILPVAIWYMIRLLTRISHLEEHIRMLATHDALTGAMTRQAFLETFENTYHYTQRNKLPLALISIELDDFKKINDALGHAVIGEILISFSSIIEEQKRKSDIFTRMGRGTFVLALPDTDVEDAITFANKLRCLAKETIMKSPQTDFQYTVSMGVSGFDPDNQLSLEQLTKQADDALTRAQHQGIDSVVAFSKSSS